MAAMSVSCAQFAREKIGLPRCVATNVLWRLKVCIFVSFLSVTVFLFFGFVLSLLGLKHLSDLGLVSSFRYCQFYIYKIE